MLTYVIMKLGEMLMADGRLSNKDLQEVLARQQVEGGRIGTLLVERGLIDLHSLTVYLGLELGIPIASGATLDRAKRSAVKLLTPEQAARFHCVPLVVQDRQLIAAVDDPNDLVTLDEITRVTGYRVIPRVAPEVRIHYYIERYYGVKRPRRFAAFGEAPKFNQQTEIDLPAPPLPGLPPKQDSAQGQPIAVKISTLTNFTLDILKVEDSDLLEELSEESTDNASPIERTRLVPAPPTLPPALPILQKTNYEPVNKQQAQKLLAQATQRGEVAEAIMRYTTSIFDVSAVFIVKDNFAFGWFGQGPKVDNQRIETILLPLDAPSVFRGVHTNPDSQFVGSTFDSIVHSYLYKILRCATPQTVAVNGISIGNRLVNIVYGHRIEGSLPPEKAKELSELCDEAGKSYVQLIRRAKS